MLRHRGTWVLGSCGIASEKDKEVLIQEGAEIVVADFERSGEFFMALESAGSVMRAPL